MNAKITVFFVYVEAIIYLLLYNLHDCTFNTDFGYLNLIELQFLTTCLNSGMGVAC